jgi:hypothetical protein
MAKVKVKVKAKAKAKDEIIAIKYHNINL